MSNYTGRPLEGGSQCHCCLGWEGSPCWELVLGRSARSHGPSSLPSGSSFSSSPSWWVCTKPRGLGLGCELMKEEVGSLVPWQR